MSTSNKSGVISKAAVDRRTSPRSEIMRWPQREGHRRCGDASAPSSRACARRSPNERLDERSLDLALGGLSGAVERQLRQSLRLFVAAGHQRDRCDPAHQSRTCPARHRSARSHSRDALRLLESRIRSGDWRTRQARCPRGSPVSEAIRRPRGDGTAPGYYRAIKGPTTSSAHSPSSSTTTPLPSCSLSTPSPKAGRSSSHAANWSKSAARSAFPM